MESSQIEPLELKKALESGEKVLLLDVREPEEHQLVALPNSKLIPLMELESKVDEVREFFADPGATKVVYCRSGGRSQMAIDVLGGSGIKDLLNLRGGVNAYAIEADNSYTPY